MSKQFASHADLADKVVSFEKLSDNAYAYTAEGDPNTGVIIGDEAVMVVDTQATPVMAQDVIRRIREVTDKPIKYILLSHYHAVRVFGASAYNAQEILASRDTYDLIAERGEQDKASEIGRFPRLFRNAESIPPGLRLADHDVQGRNDRQPGQSGSQAAAGGPRPHQGRHHCLAARAEDPVRRRPGRIPVHALLRRRLFPRLADHAGHAGRLRGRKMVPGRGPALKNATEVRQGLAGTRAFLTDLYGAVNRGVAEGKDLKTIYREVYDFMKPRYSDWVIFDHCMPFDVSRAYDEATGYNDPRIWTDKRDLEMWAQLEG